jgi:hypothetical protein
LPGQGQYRRLSGSDWFIPPRSGFVQQDNISINQFVATALAEKMSALTTETYLLNRAKRGSKKKFEHVLSKIKDIEPDKNDVLQ